VRLGVRGEGRGRDKVMVLIVYDIGVKFRRGLRVGFRLRVGLRVRLRFWVRAGSRLGTTFLMVRIEQN
jgi:hypothetical protein